MSGQTYAVILVYSTSHAMRIEKLLAEQGIACKMMPRPAASQLNAASASASCATTSRLRATWSRPPGWRSRASRTSEGSEPMAREEIRLTALTTAAG